MKRSNCIIMPNFIEIAQTAAEIWPFYDYQDGGRRHLGFVMRVWWPPTKGLWWSLSLCKIWLESMRSFDNMHVFRFREFGLKTLIHAPKLGGFSGKIGEGLGRYWPPTNLFLLLGVYTSVSNLVKIDEEMRPWECPQTDTHTHTHTHGQTQNDFIICSMLYAIAMGQIITVACLSIAWFNT